MNDTPSDAQSGQRNWLYQISMHCLDYSLRVADRSENGEVIVRRAEIMRQWIVDTWEKSAEEKTTP